MSKLNFGFHTSVNGIGVPRRFYETLDEAGIPFFAKVTDALPYDAQEIAQRSSVPHVVIVRVSRARVEDPCPSGNPDTPDYNKPPEVAAAEHWGWHKRQLERMGVDPAVTWVETINEVDKNRAEWLAEFAIATAQLTMADGYKWLAFGWSTGEPEPEHWQGPKMREFLDLVAANSDKLGVAVHEYSLSVENIMNGDGWLVGRFLLALEVNPNINIYITEWGWEPFTAPPWSKAWSDILLAGALYAENPQVKGAAIWALNYGWQDIHKTVGTYFDPLLQMTLDVEFDTGIEPPPPEPPPTLDYKAIPILLPQDATLDEIVAVRTAEYTNRRTITQSHDEALAVVRLAKEGSYVIVYDIERWPEDVQALITAVPHELRQLSVDNSFVLTYMPSRHTRITQVFGANPEYYKQFGLPGHEGIDFAVPMGEPYYAVADGVVVHASNRRWSSNTLSAYGWHVVIDHGDFTTVYAHASANLPVAVGQQVTAGKVVGYSGNTGNSTGPHLHFGINSKEETGNGYPVWRYGQAIDPAPYLVGKPLPPLEGELIDVLSFMRADPTAWRVVRHPQGNQENFRDYRYPNSGEWAMVKNGDAPQVEQIAEFWHFDDTHIYLTQDTSPDNDSQGTPRLYKVDPGKYAKRFMTEGETYHDGGHIVQFYAKADCRRLDENSGASSNTTTVLSLRRDYTFNSYGQNLTLDEVLFIQGNTETQIFARHDGVALGRVGWESPWGKSEIVELYFDRGVLTSPPRKYC